VRTAEVVTPAGSKKIRDYELGLIFHPEIEEEALENAINNISRLITGKDGTAPATEKWGKRRLAYPIKHSLEGVYVLMKFKMKPTWSRELEASLRITENILRFMLVKVGEEAGT